MSTPAEDLANAEAALAKIQPLLHGWEIHILTCIVWTPQVLHVFVERLRPEVLKLARAVATVAGGKEWEILNHPAPVVNAARDFVEAVDKAWPEMAGRRKDDAAWAAIASPRRLNT